jgi:hypothetical protein
VGDATTIARRYSPCPAATHEPSAASPAQTDAAQAARRWLRLVLDLLEKREREFFPRDAPFLRFARDFTEAVGTECNAATGGDPSGVSCAGGGDAIKLCASLGPFFGPGESGAELREDCSSGFIGARGAINPCASPRLSIRPKLKANLTMAPYHFNTDSAASSHSVAGVAIGVQSTVPVSRGAVTSAERRLPSRNDTSCSDFMTDSPAG